jgi:hypothetical protein
MNHINLLRATLLVALIFTLFVAQKGRFQERQRIFARILDEHGRPTAARVRFTGPDSTYYAPDGHDADFPINYGGDVILDNNRRFAYVDGEFSIELPQGPVTVEVVKGYAYRFVTETIDVLSNLKTHDIQLQRWFEFSGKKWYCGDVHVHHISSETALLEMKAEDLNVCSILTSDFTGDQANFRGETDPISESEHLVYVGQEYREGRLGHMNLLGLKELIEPVKPIRQFQYPLNSQACDRAHEQGGHVSWAHFAAWPGLEGPLALVTNKVDAVELLCTIEPFHAPIFASDVIPDIQMNSGLRIWYRLLNCGLRIPATAGTDKMDNRVTVGGNRVYAAVDGDFTYQSWIDALNQGRTFITNSPLLFCQVEGKDPGETLFVASGSPVKITAEMWTQLPVDRLELIANGEVIAERAITSDQNQATLTLDYTPAESVWIAARCHQFTWPDARRGVSFAQRRSENGGPTLFNQYYGTLRPEAAFAHTNPVYVLRDNAPIRSPDDAEFFVKYLDNSIRWLRDEGKFPSEEAEKEVLQEFAKGREMFVELTK